MIKIKDHHAASVTGGLLTVVHIIQLASRLKEASQDHENQPYGDMNMQD